jgi:hypothetical protein
MEIKWTIIGCAIIIIAISVDHSVTEISVDKCKVQYAQSNRSAEEILKICKRQ